MCEREAVGAASKLRLIRNAVTLVRMLPALDLCVKSSATVVEEMDVT